MAKQHKRKQAAGRDHPGTDQPTLGAGWFRGEEKAKAAKQDEQADATGPGVSVQDHLSKVAVDALSKLRAEMAAAELKQASFERAKSGLQSGGKRPLPAGAHGSSAQAQADASFAELFDPQEADDASFEELLDKSKLDWRRFKD